MNPSKFLDYRIIIKADKRLGSNDPCYVANCPTLGIADDGDTIEEAIVNIQKTIRFHLDCLKEEGHEIPVDQPQKELVTNARIDITTNNNLHFCY